MVDAKVIVIDPSDSQARTLETVLRFLDLDPVHVHDLEELAEYQRTSEHDWLAVIVGQRDRSRPRRRTRRPAPCRWRSPCR